MLLKLECVRFSTSLDLKTRYYHFQLTPNYCWICTIVLPWVKYEYCWIPMGVPVSLDKLKEKINNIFHSFGRIQAYLDDVILTTKKNWGDHLVELRRVLLRLVEAGMKVNYKRLFFGR